MAKTKIKLDSRLHKISNLQLPYFIIVLFLPWSGKKVIVSFEAGVGILSFWMSVVESKATFVFVTPEISTSISIGACVEVETSFRLKGGNSELELTCK